MLDVRDLVALTARICDIPSVSGEERVLADEIEETLRAAPHLEVVRDGDAVLARTQLGRPRRVVLAGHLDTVPVQGTLPTRLIGDELWGRGTVDMKGGVAVALHLAATLRDLAWDVTFVFYDQEEVGAERNGLGRLVRRHPRWLAADLAILGEPTGGMVEGGCNGTALLEVRTTGVTAHSARPWRGRNAIHAAAPLVQRISDHPPREADVEGLVFRESLSVVAIQGGIAHNMIPDECVVTVNYRFAPDRGVADAAAHVRALLPEAEVVVVDAAAGARPHLDHPVVGSLVDALAAHTGTGVFPKLGWTDVARFAELGVPAVNFGPGDPLLAHADDERCPIAQIRACSTALQAWLEG